MIRATVAVNPIEAAGQKSQLAMPKVFSAPIRRDLVHFVHTNMAKNSRQPYGVNYQAGMQHSAESWGTGRAVSRIPRISGGGTNRSGQGAFGNMCRKGRMFAPTRIWRKWHRHINMTQKRHAVCSALAASAIAPLVMARGHRIAEVPEVPLIVDGAFESIEKTKKGLEILEKLGASADVEKAKASTHLRAGKGKMRSNRRYVQRRGPLVVYNEDHGITRALRNLPGVELCQVERLNLLQLAPGGHMGRFVIWTKPAFERLDAIYGTFKAPSKIKSGYMLPHPMMTNADIGRIINSTEVQSALRVKIANKRQFTHKRNMRTTMHKLNPALSAIATHKRPADKVAADKKADKKHRPNMAKNYRRIVTEAEYTHQTQAPTLH